MKHEEWTVRSFITTTDENGNKLRRALEDIPKDELAEIADRMNRRALRAAGYEILEA